MCVIDVGLGRSRLPCSLHRIKSLLGDIRHAFEDHAADDCTGHVGRCIANVAEIFAAAVGITRQLGLRPVSVWIDSLCIAQVDKQDYCREAARLAQGQS